MILLLHSQSYAQRSLDALIQKKEVKPFLFAALPDQFECNSAELQKIVSAQINEQFTVQLSSQFLIKGHIVDKSQQVPGSFSINATLENYNNALFNLSVRLLADNSVAIQGRILHPKYGDVLILSKNKDSYLFKKNAQRLFMPE